MPGGYDDRRPSPALASVLTCAWVASADAGPVADPVVPDGSMDIIWNGTRLVVAGPDTTWWVPPSQPAGQNVGVRLRPGHGPSILGLPATALVDQRPDLEDLWGSVAQWEDELAMSDSVASAAVILERLVASRLPRSRGSDRVVDAAIVALDGHAGHGAVSALSDDLGVGERQLLRRFRAAVGYGPKFLHRVLRFQRFLNLLVVDPGRDLAVAAAELGYADQAHLTRDAVQLAGKPPGQLRERARRVVAANGAMSGVSR
jgi:AraC-like DNA-binding protein